MTFSTTSHRWQSHNATQMLVNYFFILASSLSLDVRFLEVTTVWIALVNLASVWWLTKVFPVVLISMDRCHWRAEWRRSTGRLIHIFWVTVHWRRCIVDYAHWIYIYDTVHQTSYVFAIAITYVEYMIKQNPNLVVVILLHLLIVLQIMCLPSRVWVDDYPRYNVLFDLSWLFTINIQHVHAQSVVSLDCL